MIKVLCFSKDRPLQLEGYLDSLANLSDAKNLEVTLLIPNEVDIPKKNNEYLDVFSKFDWNIEEQYGGFDKTLRSYIDNCDDNELILFGCDDMVFTRPFVAQPIENLMESRDDLIGFSLRLGRNITPRPMFGDPKGLFVEWDWFNRPSHWGIAIEWMATIYKAKLIKELLADYDKVLRIPNELESFGYYWSREKERQELPKMAMFNSNSYAIAADLNRVQDLFPNKIQGTQDESAAALKVKYDEGYRMDWKNYFNISPPDCFTGRQYFKLIGP